MRSLLEHEDPEGAGVRKLFRRRYDSMPQAERSRVRREARAFVTEERSIRTGRPPYDIATVTAPLVFGSSGGHNAHRTAPETFAELVRRGVSRAAGRRS